MKQSHGAVVMEGVETMQASANNKTQNVGKTLSEDFKKNSR